MVEPKAEHDYLKTHANSAYIRLNDLIIGTAVVLLALEDYAIAFKDSEKPITISIHLVKGRILESADHLQSSYGRDPRVAVILLRG
jgi:hypothetical protein